MSLPSGVSLVKMQSMNGSTPQNAAFNTMQQRNNLLSNLNNAVSGGGKTRRKYKGGNWVAPQIRTIYTDVGGPGQTATAVSAKLSSVQAQNYANGVFDSAAQQGGRRRKKTRRLGQRQRQKQGQGQKQRQSRQQHMTRRRRRHKSRNN